MADTLPTVNEITLILTTESPNESDVSGIIAHFTRAGILKLKKLSERAAAFTRGWSDGETDRISFSLPDGVTVFGLDTSLEDETTLDIGGGEELPFQTQNVVLSESDICYVRHGGVESARLIISERILTADDICAVQQENLPDWGLNFFTVVFDGVDPYFSASFSDTDGREYTAALNLDKIEELFGANHSVPVIQSV